MKKRKKSLDFVTIDLNLLKKVASIKNEFDVKNISDLIQQIKLKNNNLSVGIDLESSVLIDDNDLEKLKNLLSDLNKNNKLIDTVTIAYNNSTFQKASDIINNSNNIRFIATEVLRCHIRKPGLLTAGYPYIQSHKFLDDSTSDSITLAIEDFKMALLSLYLYLNYLNLNISIYIIIVYRKHQSYFLY